MYNEDIKLEFLKSLKDDGYNIESLQTYKNALNNLAIYEKSIGKDIYEMNLEELEEGIHSMKYRKYDRVMNLISNIKLYFRWAYDAGYTDSPDSPFSPVLPTDYYESFIHNEGDYYITREELLTHLADTPDYLMKACLLAVFEGIGGRGYQELSNIRMKDFYQENGKWYVNLVNELDDKVRFGHPISDELYKMFLDASTSTVFKGMDGEVKYHLIESEYIFRHFISRRNVNEAEEMIGQRAGAKLYEFYIIQFRDALGILDSYEKFSLKELKYSGLMHYLNEELNEQEDKELVVGSTIDKLAERFILPVQKWKDREYIVYSKVKSMIIEDFMEKAYGKKVKFRFAKGKVKQS